MQLAFKMHFSILIYDHSGLIEIIYIHIYIKRYSKSILFDDKILQ